MPGSIALERQGDVALLRLTNPPVNGLSFAMRAALGERMAEVLADDTVAAVVICGAGRMFCGGADIREFSAPPPPGPRTCPRSSTRSRRRRSRWSRPSTASRPAAAWSWPWPATCGSPRPARGSAYRR